MKYDVIVIGGGPAGMMAAGRAGEMGAGVLLVEKNKNLGVKLLITGNGRCNVTNNENDIKGLIKKYGNNGKFLFSAFNKFGVEELMDFFENRGVKLKTEANGRVFPISNRSLDILNTLLEYLKESKVEIRTEATVQRIVIKDNEIEKMILYGGHELIADKYIICTGGKSYPGTGSAGDAYHWLADSGHSLIEPRPGLTAVVLKNRFIKNLEGLSLQNIGFNIYRDNKKIEGVVGEAIFTADGLSGPVIINLSSKIGNYLPDKVEIALDFRPDLNESALDKELQLFFQENNNKDFGNILTGFVPKKIAPIFIEYLEIDAEKKVNLITRDERRKLLSLLKCFRLEVEKVLGFDKAMITVGGVDLREVDPKTMKSKIVNNLYFAGEVLDLDGPTGGYNLQICWSTGYVAGDSIV